MTIYTHAQINFLKKVIIKVLKADNGDSILIRYVGNDNTNHNILIDGGLKRTYSRVLKKELEVIFKRGELVDLVVITHLDQDHIGGILKMITDPNGHKDIIANYWFNSGRIILEYLKTHISKNRDVQLEENSPEVSFKQALTLEHFLLTGEKWHSKPIHALQKFDLFGAKFQVLSPTVSGLKRLNRKWETELKDKESKKISSKNNDYNRSIEDLLQNNYVKDTSIPNQSSIALLLNYQNKRILLAGDALSEDILESLNLLGLTSKGKRLKVDFWKLSHHGSKKSTSDELISAIECQNYIVSTNGRKANLPNKELLVKIICNPNRDINRKIYFYFNYDNPKFRSIFSYSDRLKHNFEFIFLTDSQNIKITNTDAETRNSG